MYKIYVRFGKITNPNRTEVYEALKEGEKVTILMPKANHPAAVEFARSVGFGDVPTYVVEGKYLGTDDNTSVSLLSDVVTVKKLYFDSETDTYLWSKQKPQIESEENLSVYYTAEEMEMEKEDFTFWQYLWFSLKVNLGIEA